MSVQFINKTAEKILVVGPIYDKINKLNKIEELIPNYDLIIINGSVLYPYDNIEEVKQRIDKVNSLLSSRKVIYNLSQYDLLFEQYLYETSQCLDIKKWIKSKPNVVIITFKNQTNAIITGGGLTANMKKNTLYNNLETSFVSNIDGKPWHKKYGGISGYVISNNPLTFEKPKFYKYSAQIGNAYGSDTQVYGQEIEPFGLKRTILL